MKRRTESVCFGLLACLLGSLSGCADDLDPPSRIDELRLLAVQADLPFAQAGQTVHLTALAVDPQNRALSWAWGTCLDADSSLALDCLRSLSFDSLTIGDDLTTHTLEVPATTAPSVGVAIVVCPGTIIAGNTEGIPLACQDASGTTLDISAFEIGLKRIYNRDSSLNHNPQIASITWDGEPWLDGQVMPDTCKTQKAGSCTEFVEHKIELTAPGAAETSIDESGAPVTERAIISMFATTGDFDDDVRFYDSAQTHWHARKQDHGQAVTFWFVIRDDRGGISWITRQSLIP